MTENGTSAWDEDAPERKPTAADDGGWRPQWGDGAAAGVNAVKGAGAPLGLLKNVVGNIDGVESLTDWDGYASLVTGLAGDITSVQGAAEEFWSMVEGITDPQFDPVPWLAGTLIDFLIQVFQPLDDLVGLVSGNEARMKESASMWNTIAAGAPQAGDLVAAAGGEGLGDWAGVDGDAARVRIAEAGEAIRGLGYLAVGIEGVLLYMADLAKALRQDIVDLLAKGVSWALTRLLPQVAAAVATFGATLAVAIADAVYKVASLVAKAVSRIRQCCDIFEQATGTIMKIDEALQKLAPVLNFLKTHKIGIGTGMGMVEQAGR